MNLIKRMFKRKSYNFNIETFRSITQNLNGTELALIFNDYIIKSDINYDEHFISNMLHFCSNEAMENEIFAINLLKFDTHVKMFKKSRNKNQKWLMYSALWNIFRFQENRNISKKFIQLIINDFDNITTMNSHKLWHVYFGCLSNLSLAEYNKEAIVKIFSFNDIHKIKYLLTNINTTIALSGLCCNLLVSDDIGEKGVINSKIYIELIKLIDFNIITDNNSEKERYIRNTIALINNSLSIDKFLEHFISFKILEKFQKLPKYHSDPNTDSLIDCIKEKYDIMDFQDTTSLHLANKYKFKHIVYRMIKHEEYNINTVDYLGNTILHDALLENENDLAKFYVLSDSDINLKNKEGKSAFDINTKLIKEFLYHKKEIKSYYQAEIKNEFKIIGKKQYEENLCDIINLYINKIDDAYLES